MPSTLAMIEVYDPELSIYNNGDMIPFSGFVYSDSSLMGSIDFSIICGSNILRLPAVPVSLNANQKKDFQTDLGAPKISIPSSVTGSCYLKAELRVDNKVVESASSSTFSVDNTIEGTFQLSKSQIQLGDDLILTGNLYKKSGRNVNGSAEIYFKTDNNVKYLVGVATISEGDLSYTYKTVTIQPGKYYIDVSMKDNYGNEASFTNVASFNLINEIYLTARPSLTTLKPGDKVSILGETKMVLEGIPVGQARVTITLFNESKEFELKEATQFDYSIVVPYNIKSGNNKIKVKIQDYFGNVGSVETSIDVEPVPTSMKIELTTSSIKPQQEVGITPKLYDQAKDPMDAKIEIVVLNSKGKEEDSTLALSNKQINLQLPQFALPGYWTIKAKIDDVSSETGFTVEEVSDIETWIKDQVLYIRNTGNVPYTEPIKVDVAGQEIVVDDLPINPNKTVDVEIGNGEISTGTYDINVLTGTGAAVADRFDDVSIVGKEKKSLNYIYIGIVILLFLIIVYLIYSKMKSRKRDHMIHEHERREARATLKKLKRGKEDDEGKPKKSQYLTWKSREEHVNDFKGQVLKEIKATEEKDKLRKRPGFKNNDSDNKKGMFNMFD